MGKYEFILSLIVMFFLFFISIEDLIMALICRQKNRVPKMKNPPAPPIKEDDLIETLELAKKYLLERAISTEKSKSKFYKGLIAVIPASEVSIVIDMVISGKMTDYYDVVSKLDEHFFDFPNIPRSEPTKQ